MKFPILISGYQPQQIVFNTRETYNSLQFYTDIDAYLAVDPELKIAIMQFTYMPGEYHHLIEDLERIKHFDLVIFRSIELNPEAVEVINQFDLPNFHFFTNGILHEPLQHARHEQDPFWLYSTANNYNAYDIDQKLTPGNAEYKFDLLYGLEKVHRTQLKEIVDAVDDPTCFLQSEFLEVHSIFPGAVQKGSIWWEDEIELPETNINKYHTLEQVKYNGATLMPSQVLPYKIYNQTAYSFISETDPTRDFTFYTEKLAKPMLTKRLFIVQGNQYYLRDIQNFGFKTFGNIVDESYDEIEDHVERWTAAVTAAVELAKLPEQEVQEAIREAVEHNRHMMFSLVQTHGYALPEWRMEVELYSNPASPFCGRV